MLTAQTKVQLHLECVQLCILSDSASAKDFVWIYMLESKQHGFMLASLALKKKESFVALDSFIIIVHRSVSINRRTMMGVWQKCELLLCRLHVPNLTD